MSDPFVGWREGLVVGLVVVVVCPFLCPLSLDLDLSLVPPGRRDTCISPFDSTPVSSPLPSSSAFPFSSPLALSSPLFFLPLPLPPLPLALEVTVSSLLSSAWVVVSACGGTTRTQASPLDEVVSGVGSGVADVWVSETTQLFSLSVDMEGLVGSGEVDAR